MGWLFAVGLGMQDRERRSVLRALPPIAVGHELAIALVAALVVGLGALADPRPLHLGAACALIGFGALPLRRSRARIRAGRRCA